VTGEPILIAGAGPTGLALALALGLEGMPVTIFESEPGLTVDLRAGSYHPPTIEMLSALGVGEAMHATGIVVPRWQIRDRIDGVVADFDLSLIADETPHPYRLHLEQHRLTAILLDHICRRAPSVTIEFGASVTGATQRPDGVTVTLADGREQRGWLLVGADGARSTVRQLTGVEFDGFTWPDRFLVASTTVDLGAAGFAGAGYIADPEHWAAVFHVPHDGPPGLWRIAYAIQPEEEEDLVLSPAAVNTRLHLILGHLIDLPDPIPLAYASIYRVHQRVAKQFFAGRVVLVGDAAHINNPLGGLGLNGGIHDAVNLAEKLVRVWRGDADLAEELDRYDRQRRPVNIDAVQAMSIRNKRLLEESDPTIRCERLDELRATAADPSLAKAYLMNSSMLNSVRRAAEVQ
jgi:3-(3-hydroxy-phenyl)propionate hydroxylase